MSTIQLLTGLHLNNAPLKLWVLNKATHCWNVTKSTKDLKVWVQLIFFIVDGKSIFTYQYPLFATLYHQFFPSCINSLYHLIQRSILEPKGKLSMKLAMIIYACMNVIVCSKMPVLNSLTKIQMFFYRGNAK